MASSTLYMIIKNVRRRKKLKKLQEEEEGRRMGTKDYTQQQFKNKKKQQ